MFAVDATRACVPALPTGTYYAVVTASAQNNYRIAIKALASCN